MSIVNILNQIIENLDRSNDTHRNLIFIFSGSKVQTSYFDTGSDSFHRNGGKCYSKAWNDRSKSIIGFNHAEITFFIGMFGCRYHKIDYLTKDDFRKVLISAHEVAQLLGV